MSVPAFLTPEELVVLTGYRMPSKQIEFLTRAGVPHVVNRFRRPVVRRDWEQRAVRPEPQMGRVR